MNSEEMVIVDTADFDRCPAYPSALNKIEFICPWSLRRGVEVGFYTDCSEFGLRPVLFFYAQENKIETLDLIADEAFPPKSLPGNLLINLKHVLGENIEEKLGIACARSLKRDLEVIIDYSIQNQCFIMDIRIGLVDYYSQKEIPKDDLLPFLVEAF